MTAMTTIQPLAQFDASSILGVLTDIDDTLTSDGRLTREAFAALHELADAGFEVIPVTGRSAGWAHMIVKTWPVVAVVAESGGLYLRRGPDSGRLTTRLHAPASQVDADRRALEACGREVMAQVSGLAPASDNAYRLVDYALDYCEEVPRVPTEGVATAIAVFRARGFQARASSVHVNAWRGDFDKAPMALDCLRECYRDERADPARWAFIGDAPNDESMFAAFGHSIAVANLEPSLPSLTHRPRYLTSGRSGDGFVEFARHLLAADRRR